MSLLHPVPNGKSNGLSRNHTNNNNSTTSSRLSLRTPSSQPNMANNPDRQLLRFHNTWLFSEDSFLSKSPSRKQLTLPQELQVRELMHAFLIKLGIELKLDGRTILAATVYINRFYMRMPITTSKYFFICAAIAISCKLHDCYRPPDKIALKACEIRNPQKLVDQHSSLFWQWRDQLLYREEILLKMLNFELDIDLPYDFMESLLSEKDADLPNGFYVKLTDILKHTVSKVELLSALPLLVAFDMKTIFGMVLVLTVAEAQEKFLDEQSIELPATYLQDKLGAALIDCYYCYKYVLKLKSVCEKPDLPSHKSIVGKVPIISKTKFYDVATGKQPQSQDTEHTVAEAELPLDLSDVE